MLKNTNNRYGWLSKTLHWVMALMILALLTVGFTMGGVAEPFKWTLYGVHKAVGLTALVLVALRLLWRLKNAVPALPSDTPTWQRLASNANVMLLYTFMFVMPLSGLTLSLMGGHEVSYFGLFTIPAFTTGSTAASLWASALHNVSAFALAGLVSLHFLAGLYHHFVRKDPVLMRMLWK